MNRQSPCRACAGEIGAVAHLGERVDGIDEVAGSSPVSSTIVIGSALRTEFLDSEGSLGKLPRRGRKR